MADYQHLLPRKMLGWLAGPAGNRAEEFLLPSRRGRPQNEQFRIRVFKPVPIFGGLKARRSIDNGRKPGSTGFAVESDAHQCHRHDKAEAVREAPGEQIVILCRHQKAGAGKGTRGTD